MKSKPDHEGVAMIKYGITREEKYIYHFGNYKYDSFAHALAAALRGEKDNFPKCP